MHVHVHVYVHVRIVYAQRVHCTAFALLLHCGRTAGALRVHCGSMADQLQASASRVVALMLLRFGGTVPPSSYDIALMAWGNDA